MVHWAFFMPVKNVNLGRNYAIPQFKSKGLWSKLLTDDSVQVCSVYGKVWIMLGTQTIGSCSCETPSFSDYFDSLQIIKRGAGRWTSANREGCKPLTGAEDQVSAEDKGPKAQRKRDSSGTWWTLGFANLTPREKQEVFYDAKLFP